MSAPGWAKLAPKPRARRLEAERLLKSPLFVAPLDHAPRFVMPHGTNPTTAQAALGCICCLVRAVDSMSCSTHPISGTVMLNANARARYH